MPQELFVWYRCVEGEQVRVLALATRLQAEVAQRCGVQGRLLARQDGGRDTWMEHYAPAAGQERALVTALTQALAALDQPFPERHTETFTCVVG